MSSLFSWEEEDVKLLVKKRIEFHSMFTGKRGSALAGWHRVAEVLNNGATFQQCKKKWENLLQRYKEIISPLNKDEPLEVKWPFFEDLHPFVSAHQLMNSQLICRQEPEVVTVCLPRSLLKRTPSSSAATPQAALADSSPMPNSSTPFTTKKCKVESRNSSNFEDEVCYDSDLDDDSDHSVPEAEQVPVIVEISEPASAATSRRVSESGPMSSHKRPRISEVCENIATLSHGGGYRRVGEAPQDKEHHRQRLETLQMEHRMRKNMLQTELEMTKRILQVELDIKQEELDFHRSYHRLKLKQLAQSLKMNT